MAKRKPRGKEMNGQRAGQRRRASVPEVRVEAAPDRTESAAGQVAGAGVSLMVSFEATEAARLEAIRTSGEQLLARIQGRQGSDAVWGFQEAVWPALGLPEYRDSHGKAVKLTLLPLSRIGQMEGKSGSLVLIGHFSFEEPGTLCSHPLVVKTMDRSKSNKLVDEYKNALSIKPFAYDSKDNFAIPIFFDEAQAGYRILWSICSATGSVPLISPTPGTASPAFEVEDLRKPLWDGDNERAGLAFEAAFDLLRNCHRRFGTASTAEVDVGVEYDWYLRSLGTVWGDAWVEVWGKSDEKFVPDADRQTINPLWVVDLLKTIRLRLCRGAIHGDLHPGNIILKTRGAPTIIDFGWAQERAHIAKDFVLLECNLRFLTLRTETRGDEIESFSNWIAWDATPPAGLGSYLQGRVDLIQRLRRKAGEVFPAGTDWDREYVMPLFLVAVGLLRFAPQLGNQHAAVRFVLSAAGYLARALRL
jgi:hypothetical protein